MSLFKLINYAFTVIGEILVEVFINIFKYK